MKLPTFLFIVFALWSTPLTQAGSYLKTDGAIIALLTTSGNPHAYSGTINTGHYLGDANLRSANLQDAELSGLNAKRADFSGSNLKRAHFNSTYMERAKFVGAILTDADLTNGNLLRGDFTNADLKRVKFNNVNLHFANFSGASLMGADLTGANLHSALMDNAIFDHNTTLYGGQTVGELGFNAAELETFLNDERSAQGAANLTVIPEASTLLLAAMGLVAWGLTRTNSFF